MGNATSGEDAPDASDASDAFAEAVRFKDDLADMQRALQNLCAPPSPALLPHQLALNGVVVACDPGVRVLLGPVVGKVDFQSARVLLEVSVRARITCHVSTVNTLTSDATELPHCCCTVSLEAQQPAVFRIERLAPGQEYCISFSGVHRDDAKTRHGSFRTPTLESGASKLRAAAVSGDDPANLRAGERNVWKSVRTRVEQKRVDYVLHLGGQVAMQRMFDYASLLLLRHATSLSRGGEGVVDWRGIEARAVEVLRGAYRTHWSLSADVQFVLANASNLMMWSDADVYPEFTTRSEFYINHDEPTMQMQVIRTVTRCARRLFLEYQHQLWDDNTEAVFEREEEMVAVAERALESSGKIFKLALQIPKVAQDLELQKQRREIEGARRVEKHLRALESEKLKLEKQLVSYNQILAPQRGEEFMYTVGAIALIFLDVRSARLEPGGAQAANNPLLSSLQWDFIEQTLEQEGTRLLVVCTELPVVDVELTGCAKDPEEYKNNATAWSNNSEAQVRLLSTLFDWKLERPNREVMLLSGSGRLGALSAKTTIKDAKLRTNAVQYIISSITSGSRVDDDFVPLVGISCAKLPHPPATMVMYDRFSVEHARIEGDRKGFAVLSLECGSDTGAPVIQIEQIDGSQDAESLARVVVGPVVGWVDHHSATILLEISRDADIACLIENPFTGERWRLFQRFRAHRPNSFYLTRLRSEHWYQVSFTNVQRPSDFVATFATLAPSPAEFEVATICNDAALLLTNALSSDSKNGTTASLWGTLSEKTVGVPFSGIDFVLHLGGQFFPNSSAYVHEALRMAEELCQASLTSGEDRHHALNQISEQLRKLYRLGWTVPGVREQLASGAHIFLINPNDLLPPSVASLPAGMLVQCQLRQVHHEYLNLLLPPTMRQGEAIPRVISQRFGTLGTFVLPVRIHGDGDSGTSIQHKAWVELDAFLEDEAMQMMLLVTTEPIIRESPSDILEKAKTHSAYRGQFGFHRRDLERLLGVLFRWQQSQSLDSDNGGENSSGKRVILLSGDQYQSFESVIRQFKSSEPIVTEEQGISNSQIAVGTDESHRDDSSTIRQLVVGPLHTASPEILAGCGGDETCPQPLVFFEGALFGQYTYTHSRQAGTSFSSNDRAQLLTEANEQGENSKTEAISVTKSSQLLFRGQYLRASFSLTQASRSRVQVEPANEAVNRRASIQVSHISINGEADQYGMMEPTIKMKLPAWLLKLMKRPLTPEEQAQMDERAALLQDKAAAITTTFEQSPSLVEGLLGFSLDSHGCVAELARLFEEFYGRFGGSAVREKFPAPPSPLTVRLILFHASTDASEDFPTSGAIDASSFEHLLTRCFLDGWVLSCRLSQLFKRAKDATASIRREA